MHGEMFELFLSTIRKSNASKSISKLDRDLTFYDSIACENHFNGVVGVVSTSGSKPKIACKLARGLKYDGKNGNILVVDGEISSRLEVIFRGLGSVVYISGDVGRKVLKGRLIVNAGSSIFIGAGVSSHMLEVNVSRAFCVIGDDCMFARNVNVRTHSGHAFYNIKTKELESDSRSLHIEPHVWIGEHVKVFRASHIGACSIIGYNSLLLSDVPSFCIYAGSPAKQLGENYRLWTRSCAEKHLLEAKYYYDRFCA